MSKQGVTEIYLFEPFTDSKDPISTEDVISVFLANQIHSQLFRMDPEGRLRPDLASSAESMENHTRFVITLGKHTFASGAKVTADDVVYSFRRIFEEKAAIGSDLQMIRGSALNSATPFGVVAKSREVVEFVLTQSTPSFLFRLAAVDCSIVQNQTGKTSDASNSARWHEGSGAYRVTQDTKTLVVLEHRKDLEKTNAPQTVRIHFQVLNSDTFDSNTSTSALAQVSSPNVDAWKPQDTSWSPAVIDSGETRYLRVSSKTVPLAVRRLILEEASKGNWAAIIHKAFSPPVSVIPSGLLPMFSRENYLDAVKNAYRSKDTATTRFTTVQRPLTYAFVKGNAVAQTLGNELQKILESNNGKLKFVELSPEEYGTELGSFKYDFLYLPKGIDYPDPVSFAAYFDPSFRNALTDDRDPILLELINTADKETNPQKRSELFSLVNQRLIDRATIIPVASGSMTAVYYKRKMLRVPPMPYGIHNLRLADTSVPQ